MIAPEPFDRDTETFSSHRAGVFLHPDQVLPLDLNRTVLLYKDPGPARRGHPEAVRLDRADEAAQQSPEPAAATETFVEMAGYLHEQIANQAVAGGESLVTKLRAAEVDDERLDDNEILTFFGLLVFAGNDTTRNTASGGTLALLEHADQLAMLREDASLIPQAVEEILRYTSVVNYFVRTATTDTTVGDQEIAEGDKVVLWYTSASRDEAVYADPQRFDIRRAEQNPTR